MKRYCTALFACLLLIATTAAAQSSFPVKKGIRVITDNDFSGDPDGLFQLVHLLLSPSVETRAIIGSHLSVGDFIDASERQAENAAAKVKEVLKVMHLTDSIPVLTGSNRAMPNDSTPVQSEAVNFIIKEALRTDTKQPLYIICGAGLSEVASALLTNPSIANKFTLVWIGGPEYQGLAVPPPGGSALEYNLAIDIAAAKVVFNQSSVALWQVPRNAYRQALISTALLQKNILPKGAIGNYLCQQLAQLMQRFSKGRETYILGDSPLVLLTALQSYFEADPASSVYVKKPAPFIDAAGQYIYSDTNRLIRVYTQLDIAFMFSDFFAKLDLYAAGNK